MLLTNVYVLAGGKMMRTMPIVANVEGGRFRRKRAKGKGQH